MDFLDLHPFVRSTVHDKALGVIFGAALGDGIGLYTEFLPRTESYRAYPDAKFTLAEDGRTPFREDSHRDKFSPGDWTDDTDQSLLLILSYLHNFSGGERSLVVDAKDIAVRINIWIKQGLRCLDRPPLGIGQTIGRVVLDPDYLEDPEKTALKIWVKSKRNAAPNGSLMRTHPLGVLCVGRDLEDTFSVAAAVGRVTHIDPRCVVSCCLATALVRGILRGEIVCEADVDALIEKAYNWVNTKEEFSNPESKYAEAESEIPTSDTGIGGSILDHDEYEKHCHAQSFEDLQLDDSQKMGYVYKCLGSGVLALRLAMRKSELTIKSTGIFEFLITKLTMEGGDADTNACVAGSFLGAWIGYSRLPPHWRDGIRSSDWLLKKAESVVMRVGILKLTTDDESQIAGSDPDTALDGGRGMLTKEQLDKRERDFVMMILLKQKERREAEERERKATKGTGLGKWFK